MQYIGIDSGGTKTAFSLFADNLARIDQLVLPTAHFGQAGLDGMERVLREGIDTLAARNGVREFGVGIGLAGYGEEPAISARIDERVARVVAGRPCVLVN